MQLEEASWLEDVIRKGDICAISRAVENGYDFSGNVVWTLIHKNDDILRYILQNGVHDLHAIEWASVMEIHNVVLLGDSTRKLLTEYGAPIDAVRVNSIKAMCVHLIWLSKQKKIPLISYDIMITDIVKRVYDQRMNQ